MECHQNSRQLKKAKVILLRQKSGFSEEINFFPTSCNIPQETMPQEKDEAFNTPEIKMFEKIQGDEITESMDMSEDWKDGQFYYKNINQNENIKKKGIKIKRKGFKILKNRRYFSLFIFR